MNLPSPRLPLLAASLVALVATGCGARTVLRDTDDAGVTTDATPGVDVPTKDVPPTPIDVPTPPPIDVPFPFLDVPTPPPIDVPFPFLDVPVPPPVDVPVPFLDVPVPPRDLPLPTSSCERALLLGESAMLPAQDTAGLVGTAPPCAAVSFVNGAPLWYRVRVPARQLLTVLAVSDPGVRPPAIRLYDSCAARSCRTGSNTTTDGRTVTVRSTNASAADQELLIAVSSLAPGLPARFTLLTGLSPAPTNVTCASATPIRDSASLSAQDPSTGSDVQAPCPGQVGVPPVTALYYTAVVPPGQSLFATATPEGPVRSQAHVRIIPACGSVVCLAASTPSGTAATASWFNAGATEQPVVVSLGSAPTGTGDRFTMTFRIRPPATNSACAAATRVANGATLRAESLADARSPAPWCSTGNNGNALYYAVRVGPGEQLAVRANNATSTFPIPTLRLSAGCASTACLATSTNAGGPGNAAQLSYVNTTAAAQELVLAVDPGGLGVAPFRFDLTVSVALPPYRVARISVACDNLAAGAVIPGASGDDTGTPAIALPVVFPYFGAQVSAWSVSTNGYLQLWPSLGNSSTGALGVTALPSSAAPSNMVAPFWDDLEVRAGMDVRWQTLTDGGRHLTAQWTDVGFCCGGGTPDRVRFQVKLFERTGVIEFHYCDVTGTARATGGGASIGIQDAGGLRGVSVQTRMPTIDPMTAYRFTPTG
ncbi:MAG: bacillopeptidase [Myxococcaceae bacterium]|nr:bacillopeptidase [Myxococcaceae bacterium]